MPSLNPDEMAHAARVSKRWVQWRERIAIDDYEARFAQLEAQGLATHGEADFIQLYRPLMCLDAGCGTGRVAIELARRGVGVVGVDLDADMIGAARSKAPEITWHIDDLARMDLAQRFDVIAMPGNVMIFCDPPDRAAIVANLRRHLLPDGTLIAGFSLEPNGYSLAEFAADAAAAGLSLAERFATWERDPWVDGGNYHVSVLRS